MDLPLPKVSATQFLDGIAGVVGYSPEMEAAARKMGFKNAEQWILFENAKSRKFGGTVGQGKDKAVPGPKQSTPKAQPQASGGIFGWTDRVSKALNGGK